MHEHGLARELWPQLKGIAEGQGFKKVSYLEMIVGMLHGVSAEFLEHSFEHTFEGTCFEGADIEIIIVEPGQKFRPPSSEESDTATGWELLVVKMQGEK